MVQAKRINNRGESQPLVHSMNATMSKRGRYTRLMMFLWHFQFEQPFFSCAFTHPMPRTRQSAGSHYSCRRELLLQAAPTRLSENMEGVLYVNDKCINCAACSNFAPSTFQRNDSIQKHIVYKQPSSSNEYELQSARAALAACPVAAIRIEKEVTTEKDLELKSSLAIGKDVLFPRPITSILKENGDDLGVYYLGHHNDASFGATPYLIIGKSPDGNKISVMVDVPRYSVSAIKAVKSLAPNGPDYMFLTHVDDTADHNAWAAEFPKLKRIFHSGDLGKHNWIGDTTLEDVEILLKEATGEDGLYVWDINGNRVETSDGKQIDEQQFQIFHTPGHSPGSISLLFRPKSERYGVLFTGDTYAWTTRDGGHMSGFPRYGNNLKVQTEILQKIGRLADKWNVIAPGHGHPRFYSDCNNERKISELDIAIDELNSYK